MMNLHAINEQFSWTDDEYSIKKLEENHKIMLPLVAKTTATTSTEYDLAANSVVLLLAKQQVLRVIAQGIEKTCYVIGPQLEIPSTCKATFSVCNAVEREHDNVKCFTSVKQIAHTFPNTVYLLEEMTVTLPNDDGSGKFFMTTFKRGEQLHILNLAESSTCEEHHYQNARTSQHIASSSCLHVSCTRLGKNFHLPYSVKARFSTQPPVLNSRDESPEPVSLHELIEHANFPLTVVLQTITGHYCPENGKRLLHSGMRLKFLGLEEHLVCLAVVVDPEEDTYEVREFTSDATFLLPQSLFSSLLNESEVLMQNEYLEQVQSSVSSLNLHDTNSLVAKYCQFVRGHVPGTKKSVDRKTLSNIACLRNIKFDIYRFKWKSARGSLHPSRGTSCDSDEDNDSMWGEFAPNTDSRTSSPKTPAESEDNEVASILEGTMVTVEENDTIYDDDNSDGSEGLSIHPGVFSLRNQSVLDESALTGHSRDHTQTHRNQSAADRLYPNFSEETVPKEPFVDDSRICQTTPKRLDGDETVVRSSAADTPHPVPKSESDAPAVLPNIHVANVSEGNKSESKTRSFLIHLHVDDSSVRVLSSEEVSLSTRSDDDERTSGVKVALNHQPSVERRDELGIPKIGFSQSHTASSSDTYTCNSFQSHAFTDQSTQNTSTTPASQLSRHYNPPPMNWRPPNDVSSMSVIELCNSLRYIGMKEELVEVIFYERIDGHIFTKLPTEVFKNDLELNDMQGGIAY